MRFLRGTPSMDYEGAYSLNARGFVDRGPSNRVCGTLKYWGRVFFGMAPDDYHEPGASVEFTVSDPAPAALGARAIPSDAKACRLFASTGRFMPAQEPALRRRPERGRKVHREDDAAE